MMTAGAISPREAALLAAQAEGFVANSERWRLFAGGRKYHELQALNVRFGNAVRTYFAHAQDASQMTNLVLRAEKEFDCAGIYVLANPIKPAVATRAEVSKWHPAQKGESTTDSDIAARMVFVCDVDAVRPKGTSATDAEMAATAVVAERIYETFAAFFEGDAQLAYGHSGNGRMVLVALDALPNEERTLRTTKAILIALDGLFSTAEAKVDPAVCDAKRLIPAWGTMKKKGAPNVAERPHRRTALLCAPTVTRASMADLERLLATLRVDCSAETNALIDKELGVKPPPAPRNTPSIDSPFRRANELRIEDVVTWLGLMDGDVVRCPGCGEADGSSVVLINNGLKCSHARCALKGKPAGFRTPVDVVVEAHNVSPIDAVVELAERFGFDAGFGDRRNSDAASEAQAPPPGRFDDEPSSVPEESGTEPEPERDDRSRIVWAAEMAVEDPPIPWVCEALHVAPGRPAVFAGEGGTAKSMLAAHFANCVGTGRRFLKRYEVLSGPVLWVDYEQGRSLTKKRQQRFARAEGWRLEDFNDRLGYLYKPFFLDSTKRLDRLCKLIDEFRLVVVDSARRSAPALKENDAEASIPFDLAAEASEKTGVSFLLIDHASTKRDPDGSRKATQRGHSTKLDGCGVLYALSKQGKNKPTLVTCEREQLTGEFMEDWSFDVVDVVDPSVQGRPATKEEQKWGLALIEKGAEAAKDQPEAKAPEETQADREAKLEQVAARILEIVKGRPGISTKELQAAAPRMRAADFDAARLRLERTNRIYNRTGKKTRTEWVAV